MLIAKAYCQDMASIIRQMPDSIIPTLTKNNRLDFIDYMNSNMKAEVQNHFNKKSEMTVLTSDYARIRTTEKSDVTIKLLTSGTDTTICLINTYTSSTSDSRIKFYTTKWEQLNPSQYITLPQSDEFFTHPANITDEEYQNLRNKADITFLKAEFENNSSNLIITYTTPSYMSDEDSIATAPLLRPTIKMKWQGNKFIKEQ
jgi:hypothetical protein